MTSFRKDIVASIVAVVVCTVMLGLVYPLAVTGVSQVLFPNKADGSQVERDGKTVGSRLIGQDFRKPVLDKNGNPKEDEEGNPVLTADQRFFQSRPSQSDYAADATFFTNLGPNNKELFDTTKQRIDDFLALERPYTPGLAVGDIPVDAVTSSSSGVDPHISEANARIQANRIAKVRGLPLGRVIDLVEENTDDRFAGFLGEPGVNVLELNLAIDEASPGDRAAR